MSDDGYSLDEGLDEWGHHSELDDSDDSDEPLYCYGTAVEPHHNDADPVELLVRDGLCFPEAEQGRSLVLPGQVRRWRKITAASPTTPGGSMVLLEMACENPQISRRTFSAGAAVSLAIAVSGFRVCQDATGIEFAEFCVRIAATTTEASPTSPATSASTPATRQRLGAAWRRLGEFRPLVGEVAATPPLRVAVAAGNHGVVARSSSHFWLAAIDRRYRRGGISRRHRRHSLEALLETHGQLEGLLHALVADAADSEASLAALFAFSPEPRGAESAAQYEYDDDPFAETDDEEATTGFETTGRPVGSHGADASAPPSSDQRPVSKARHAPEAIAVVGFELKSELGEEKSVRRLGRLVSIGRKLFGG